MGLFLDESSAAAIQAGVDYMHIVTPFYFIVTIKVMCDGVLRGGSAMLYFMTTTFTDLSCVWRWRFSLQKGLVSAQPASGWHGPSAGHFPPFFPFSSIV